MKADDDWGFYKISGDERDRNKFIRTTCRAANNDDPYACLEWLRQKHEEHKAWDKKALRSCVTGSFETDGRVAEGKFCFDE